MSEFELEVSESEKKIYDDLNKLRTEPKSMKESIEKAAKVLIGIPSKKAKGEDLLKHAKTLDKLAIQGGIVLSPGLCNSAHDILKGITQVGLSYHENLSKEDFKFTCRKHVGGFKHIISISDRGLVDTFFARAFINDLDTHGEYKKTILNSNTTFCGVASVIINDEATSVLILADNISEGSSKMVYEPEDYPDFYEAYKILDVNKNNRLDNENIKKILLDIGYFSKSPVVFEILQSMDNESTKLQGADFNSFMETIMNKANESNKDSLYQIFRLFKDDPSTDTISLRELKRVATELNDQDFLAEITGLIRLARTDATTLTFDEFTKYYN